MKPLIVLIIGFLFAHYSLAATVLEGSFPSNFGTSYQVYLKELPLKMDNSNLTAAETTADNKDKFQFHLAIEEATFFNLSVIIEFADGHKSNSNTVVYLRPGKKLKLHFLPEGKYTLKTDYPKVRDKDNRSLLEVQDHFAKLNRMLFDESFDPITTKEKLKKFYTISDSILHTHKVQPAVQKYIQFYSFDQYNTSMYRFGMDLKKFAEADVQVYYSQPKDPLYFFNDAALLCFYTGIADIVNYLDLSTGLQPYARRKTLGQINQQYDILDKMITNSQVKDNVLERLLSNYTSNYRIGGDYESDLTAYTALATKITNAEFQAQCITAFENLRFTLPGSSWPDVKLRNLSGETVNLEKFKGQYVLIDVWASWCVPCIKMMPHLQALEKEYAGQNIVFIAISIDADASKWQQKNKELQLEGHQLLDQQSDFAKQLNITGIPHYLLYDPEGKLVEYKTAFPDSPQLKKLLDQHLKKQ